MGANDSNSVTQLLHAATAGDSNAERALYSLVYEEMRVIARRHRFVGGNGQTLQPTALANEAFVALHGKILPGSAENPANRRLFFLVVGQAMRQILRDYWRQTQAEKRGGGRRRALQPIEQIVAPSDSVLHQLDFLALDEALQALQSYNQRWHDVVLYRYFAGRTNEETAFELQIAVSTVKSDWQLARAWLLSHMERDK